MKKKILRATLLFVICNFSFLVSKAQWVSIPDTMFGKWLKTNYSSCMQGNSSVGWQMDTTCSAVLSTHVVATLQYASDLTGIQYFDNLQTLICNSIHLSNLPAIPKSLTTLSCLGNQLSSLPSLPNSLITLDCQLNQLTSLPALPDSLWSLHCNNNQLSSLPALPNSLDVLYCNSNQLTSLPSLSHLGALYCYDNHLTSLPALPNSLGILDCHNNQLSSIPSLHASVYDLDCHNNQISSLPPFSNSLQRLTCYDNQLISLPSLPNSLVILWCNRNQLTSLPELPDSLFYFNCSDNPSLFCLPHLKKIRDFDFSNTGITCLPDYPESNSASDPVLSNIPICDLMNINHCAYCHAHFSIYPDTANAGVYYGYNESSSSSAGTYLWEFGDGDTSSLPYPSHHYLQPGQYNLCLTITSPDCSNTYCDSSFLVFKTEGGLMSQINILAPVSTAISSIPNPDSEFRISPNPVPNSTSPLTISIDETLLGSNLSITDITGREVLHSAVQIRNPQFDIRNFLPGVYLVSVTAVDGRKAVKKLLIE